MHQNATRVVHANTRNGYWPRITIISSTEHRRSWTHSCKNLQLVRDSNPTNISVSLTRTSIDEKLQYMQSDLNFENILQFPWPPHSKLGLSSKRWSLRLKQLDDGHYSLTAPYLLIKTGRSAKLTMLTRHVGYGRNTDIRSASHRYRFCRCFRRIIRHQSTPVKWSNVQQEIGPELVSILGDAEAPSG